MSTPSDPELLGLAVPYALDAVGGDERAVVERRVASAPEMVAAQFWARVSEVRETMAHVSVNTAAPPPAGLRKAVLAHSVREPRWRRAALVGTAAVVIALGGFGAGWVMRPAAEPPAAESVLTAPDVRATSTEVRTGGTATFVYSRARGGGVLVLSNVAPPASGMGYRLWLMKDGVPVAAGTATGDGHTVMVPDIERASALGMTLERVDRAPGAPPGDMVARVPLS